MTKEVDRVRAAAGAADGDVFAERMQAFATYANEQLAALNAEFTASVEAYHGVVRYFGEDPKTVKPEDFFTTLNEFVTSFRVCSLACDVCSLVFLEC